MNVASLLFNSLVDVPMPDADAIPIQMTGPQVVQEGHVADLLNCTSAASAGVYVSKTLFKQHAPYSISEGDVVILHTHFIREVRRQLSGVITASDFNDDEQYVYDNYVLEVNGGVYDNSIQAILDALDFWLIEEVQNNEHPTPDRTYDDAHPWMKIQTR